MECKFLEPFQCRILSKSTKLPLSKIIIASASTQKQSCRIERREPKMSKEDPRCRGLQKRAACVKGFCEKTHAKCQYFASCQKQIWTWLKRSLHTKLSFFRDSISSIWGSSASETASSGTSQYGLALRTAGRRERRRHLQAQAPNIFQARLGEEGDVKGQILGTCFGGMAIFCACAHMGMKNDSSIKTIRIHSRIGDSAQILFVLVYFI